MNPRFCIGYALPDITLVKKGDKNAIFLEKTLGEGQTMKLTLSQPRGYAIVPKFKVPERILEWGVAYQHWGLGSVENAAEVFSIYRINNIYGKLIFHQWFTIFRSCRKE